MTIDDVADDDGVTSAWVFVLSVYKWCNYPIISQGRYFSLHSIPRNRCSVIPVPAPVPLLRARKAQGMLDMPLASIMIRRISANIAISDIIATDARFLGF